MFRKPFRSSFRSFRRLPRRRRQKLEVSQGFQQIVLDVAPSSELQAPTLGYVHLASQKQLIQSDTGQDIFDPSVRGVSVAWCLLQVTAVTTVLVNETIAYAIVADGVFQDQMDPGTNIDAVPVIGNQFNPFLTEVGGLGTDSDPVQEVRTFPKRTLKRRQGLMQIGSAAASGGPELISSGPNLNNVGVRNMESPFKVKRAFLKDNEALFYYFAGTNSTLATVSIAVQVLWTMAYRVVR